MRYELAKGIQDCNMLVVDGDWKKQLEYGPSSFLARFCGKSIIHLDSLKLNNDWPTDPKQLKVAHFLQIGVKDRCTTWKIFVSEACKLKHSSFFAQLCMLSELRDSNTVPISHRCKFEQVHGDVSCIVRHLSAASGPRAARSYRWLVVKEEMVDALAVAAAALLNTTPRSAVKIVMLVSQFVPTLGARNVSVDQGHRHA